MTRITFPPLPPYKAAFSNTNVVDELVLGGIVVDTAAEKMGAVDVVVDSNGLVEWKPFKFGAGNDICGNVAGKELHCVVEVDGIVIVFDTVDSTGAVPGPDDELDVDLILFNFVQLNFIPQFAFFVFPSLFVVSLIKHLLQQVFEFGDDDDDDNWSFFFRWHCTQCAAPKWK